MSSGKVTLYKYVSSEYLEDILSNQHLYLDDGSNFNDPYELRVVDEVDNETKRIEGLHILSLTNSFRKKLMWSHYSQSHRGACLTVEVNKDLVRPICYTTERIKNNNVDKIISSTKINAKRNISKDYSSFSRDKKIAYIKDKSWSYEKEYRIVLDKEGEKYLEQRDGKWFMDVKITNVYLGVNFEDKDKISAICKEKGISLKQMDLTKNNYEIIVKNTKNK